MNEDGKRGPQFKIAEEWRPKKGGQGGDREIPPKEPREEKEKGRTVNPHLPKDRRGKETA